MANLFKFFILTILFSNYVYALNIRKIYFSAATYANSNIPSPGTEGIITIKNTSAFPQKILKETDVTLNIYSYTDKGISNTILKTPAMKKIAYNGVITDVASLNNFTLQPQENLLMIYSISPTIYGGVLKSSNSTYLGRSLLSGVFGFFSIEKVVYGNDFDGGDYIGYILFKGSISVEDSGNSGFLNASGAIIKPSSRGTLNTAETVNFKINNQVPF